MGVCHSDSSKSKTIENNLGKANIFKRGEIFYGKRGNNSDKLMGPVDNSGGSEKIEIFLTLTNVKNPNSIYKIVTSICNNESEKFMFLAETDNESGDNIIFNISLIMDYFFEKQQVLKFDIISNDNKNMVTVYEVLGKIMGSRKKSIVIPLHDQSKIHFADMIADCKVASKNLMQLNIKISCMIISTQSKMDVFYLINNFNDKKNWRTVYKSKEMVGYRGSNINFPEIKLMKDEVCGESNNNQFQLEFYDSFTEKIGWCKISLNQLSLMPNCPIYPPNANIDQIMIAEKPVGEVTITYKEQSASKFLDYLSRGMQINLVVGVDFTCSNGQPEDPLSLHYMKSPNGSPYERAIASCGKIVAFYDYDQKFPVFGFGGYPPNQNIASHCFNLNFNHDPYVDGLDGVISCYRNSVPLVRQHGPTYFAPLINSVRNEIIREADKKYYILMIITDGMINDMDETCDALVSCDILPLSVIIIGVGNANFTNMNILDGDDEPLTDSYGVKTKRDLVQFVEFNKFANDPAKLAEEVLQEIPRQVEDYFSLANPWNI